MTHPNPAAAIQPAGDADLYQCRMRPTWKPDGEGWTEWANCCKFAYEDYAQVPKNGDWQFEGRALYTHLAAPVQAAHIPEKYVDLEKQTHWLQCAKCGAKDTFNIGGACPVQTAPEVKASELPSIGDDAKFGMLLHRYRAAPSESLPDAAEQIVAYIDARSPVAAPQPDVSAKKLAAEILALPRYADVMDLSGNFSLEYAPNHDHQLVYIDNIERVIKKLKSAAPESAEPSAEAVTNKAHGMYRAMVDSSGIHENRFAGWRELSALMQEEWKDKARAALATSSAAKGEA